MSQRQQGKGHVDADDEADDSESSFEFICYLLIAN